MDQVVTGRQLQRVPALVALYGLTNTALGAIAVYLLQPGAVGLAFAFVGLALISCLLFNRVARLINDCCAWLTFAGYITVSTTTPRQALLYYHKVLNDSEPDREIEFAFRIWSEELQRIDEEYSDVDQFGQPPAVS